MKKLLIAAIAVTVVGMVLVSCTQTKVYSLDLALFGICQEISTSDADLQDNLVAAGYAEEACPSANAIGTCNTTDPSYGEMGIVYYSGSLFSYTVVEAEADCEGTWSAN